MRPFWLDLEPWILGLALTLWVLVLGGIVWLVAARRRRSHERLRQLVLGRLQLAVERGLPLPEALRALGQDLARRASGASRPWSTVLVIYAPWVWLMRALERTTRRESETALDIAAMTREGGLESGLAAAPGAFPDPWPELLGKAEARGMLAAALDELRRLEREGLGARESVRGLLLYPAVVLVATMFPVVFHHVALRPKLDLVAADVGAELSPVAAAMVGAERIALAAAPLLLFALWLGAGLLAPCAGGVTGWLARSLPGTRGLQAAAARAQASRLLAAAVRAGLPLPEALEALQGVPGLPAQGLQDAIGLAREGDPLEPACRAAGLASGPLPPGSPGQVLDGLARHHQSRLAVRVAALTALAFPAALLTAGALIAFEDWIPFLYVEAITRRMMW